MKTVKLLEKDIKEKNFKNVYLLYGEENYLKRSYKNRLKKAILNDENDTMNYSYFEGKDIDEIKIVDTAETLPFFADNRLIIVENSGFFKESKEKIADYVNNICESTIIVFIENEIDKRNRLYKAVNKNGLVVELGIQKEDALEVWIGKYLNSVGKKMLVSNVRYLLETAGSNMDNLMSELEKLTAYTLGRDEITREDIDAVVVVEVTGKIFLMVESIAKREQQKALALYDDLLKLKEPPLKILFLIARQFNQLLIVKEMTRLHNDKSEIAKKAQAAPFAVPKLQSQCSRFTTEQLKMAIEDCIETETLIKSGKMTDVLGVEMLIIKYSSKC